MNANSIRVESYVMRALSLTPLSLAAAALLGISSSICTAQEPTPPRMMVPVYQRPVRTLENSSLIYRKPEPPKTLHQHDTLTVVVSISTVLQAEGDIQNKKKVSLKGVLTDWIKLDLRVPFLGPDQQSQGDPTVAGTYDSKYRAEADMQARERLTFKMGCEVIELMPNGNLRIEGTRSVTINEEKWLLHIKGEVSRSDIDENKTVTDDKIANFEINKMERGQVRDGYRRGWFQRFFDRFQPI